MCSPTKFGYPQLPLTDTAVRAARPRDKAFKLADGAGLHVVVTPSGGKLWRLKYRYAGKEKLLSLGAYPAVNLKAARDRRDEAKRMLADQVDPGGEKRNAKLIAAVNAANTFDKVAEEYIAKRKADGLAPGTTDKQEWFRSLLAPSIGNRAMTAITLLELRAAIVAIEQRGRRVTAHYVRGFADQVFRHAIATGRAERNVASDMKGTLLAVRETPRAAILEPKGIGGLLRAIDVYDGQPSPCSARAASPSP